MKGFSSTAAEISAQIQAQDDQGDLINIRENVQPDWPVRALVGRSLFTGQSDRTYLMKINKPPNKTEISSEKGWGPVGVFLLLFPVIFKVILN